MQKISAVKDEHRKACDEIAVLERKGKEAGIDGGPLPEDRSKYFHLHTVRETLEWVCIDLIETNSKPSEKNYINELMGHKFYSLGPVVAILTYPRP